MARLDLRVPFAEKDEARRLGARWDPQQKVWYVPDGVDPTPLRKWEPLPVQPNIRAASYFVAGAEFVNCFLGYEGIVARGEPDY